MSVSLFDPNFYRAANSDLANLNDAQALQQFQTSGLNEGRRFSPFVALDLYRSSNSDLASMTNRQLFDHLQNNGIREGRRFSEMVDLGFYRSRNSDLNFMGNEQLFEHLRSSGVSEGRRFDQFVDLSFYRFSNTDLGSYNNRQLLDHLEIYGLQEGRRFSPLADLSVYRSRNTDLASYSNRQLLNHLEVYGIQEGRRFSTFVDLGVYRSRNTDLSSFTNLQMLNHLEVYGLNEGRSFSVAFDVSYYRTLNPDFQPLQWSNSQLLQHFEVYGVNEGRISSAGYNAKVYLENNADLKALNWGYRQLHDQFVLYGYTEGRPGSDYAGNTFGTARSISVGSNTTTFTDFTGSNDANDFYRFTLSAASSFNLSLTGLSANADVQLLDSNGALVQSSSATGTGSEAIAQILNAGTYSIRVYQNGASQNTNYALAVSAIPAGVYKYNFTYYYNGSNASADYYTGYVYGNAGAYTVGGYFDYTSTNNQAGYNGKYYISSSSLSGSSSDVGRVYVTTYYDVDSSGSSYSAYYGNLAGYTPGNYGLGQESDYIYGGSSYYRFGYDTEEADVPRSLATVTIAATTPNAAEPSTPGQFTITRTGSTATALTVNYSVGGTATNGSDYSQIASSVTIAAGQSSALIPINIIDDSLVEGSETIVLTLNSNSGYTLGSSSMGTVTIADNDASLSANNWSFSNREGDTGTFQVSLSQAPTSNVTVTWSTSSFLTIDANNVITDGTQNTLTFTPSNWNIAQTISFIAEKDGSSTDRSSNTISYTLSGGLTGSGGYQLGNIVNTYVPDTSRFNIDLDFRNDSQNFWTLSRRVVAQRAADDWATSIVDEFSGKILSGQSLDMVGVNGKTAFTFVSNRFIDDIVIFVGSYNGGDLAAGWGGSELGGWTASEPLTRAGDFTVNVQKASEYTDAYLYSLVSHEIGHTLGLLGNNQKGAGLIDKSSPQTAVFKGEFAKAANGGVYIPLQSQDGLNSVTSAYDYSHPADRVRSMMSYAYNYNLSAPTNIDFAMMADIGYKVRGVNA